MKKCRLTITTETDGRETSVVREGEMELSSEGVFLQYREENAVVTVTFRGESAEISRVGDYSLKLSLRRGEQTKGSLGFGDACGDVEIYTHKVAYSTSEDSLLFSLRYDLIISGETQTMKLRALGRFC